MSAEPGKDAETGEALSLEQRVADEIRYQYDLNDMTFGIPAKAMARAAIRLVCYSIARDIEAELIPDARNVSPDAEYLNDGLRLAALTARNGASS